MKLQFPFIQLPLHFDAEAIAAELAGIGETEWIPHPQGFAGNSALPLIAVNGNPHDEGFAGPMRPTPVLGRLPYLRQVLGEVGAVLGRTRLMRLLGNAEVSLHTDQGYYWAERVRVHVPIVTTPTVRFHCGDAELNMQAGECWIFDTWRPHRVLNNAQQERIHLVIDTIGGDGLDDLITRGRPHHLVPPGWSTRQIGPRLDAHVELQLENVNLPRVMSPWELRTHLNFLISEAMPHPNLGPFHQAMVRFVRSWQALWSAWGDADEARPRYRALLDGFLVDLGGIGSEIVLQNEVRLVDAMQAMVTSFALSRRALPQAPARPAPAPDASNRDLEFDRPVFIVSPPRSGSTLLFETLAQAPDVCTIGDESHALIGGMRELHPAARGFESNRLDASAATDDVAATLRARFRVALFDRDGARPRAWPLRMLEKTPKNALRIPFLARVFPEALFVYLHREPREVLASMIDAWTSGAFRTYPQLPGWSGPPWSLLLTPGWRDLARLPLPEIVAAQYQATVDALLTDLGSLPGERVHVARYDALLADPQAEVARICAAVGFGWDRPLERTLPPSRNTLTPPDKDKWRRHEAAIGAVLPGLSATITRIAAFAAR